MQIEPIGLYKSQLKSKLLLPRQGILEKHNLGQIQIQTKFKEGLADLQGIDRLWIIFHFHQNQSWKIKVLPPTSLKKRGVFSTRSPYRPNFLGLTCCRLEKIEKNTLTISGADLIDGTPIFDIKPYLPYADSFPKSQTGWIGEAEKGKHKIKWSPLARKQKKQIENAGLLEVIATLITQLSYHPTDASRKRVKRITTATYEFAYRYLRVQFSLNEKKDVVISEITSRLPSAKSSVQINSDDFKLHQLLTEPG